MHWIFWMLIVVAVIVFIVNGIDKEFKKEMKPINDEALELYNYVQHCESLAAWVHWKHRVEVFEAKHPRLTGVISNLKDALIDRAQKLTKIEKNESNNKQRSN